jgi:hypothetical protein
VNSLIIQVEGAGFYNGYNVLINGKQAYYRPYDGSHGDEVLAEFAETLGAIVRERLGHPEEEPERPDDW